MNLKKLNSMIPFICICIGSLVAIIAAYVDYQNKLKEKEIQLENEVKRSQEYGNIISKNNTLMEKSNDIIVSQKAVIDTTSKIIELQNELSNKNNQIQELQNKVFENITGGKGVPKIYFIVIGGISIYIKIINGTDLPIRNVSVKIDRTVLDGMISHAGGTILSNDNPNAGKDFELNVGDLSINTTKNIYEEKYPTHYKKFVYIYEVRWLNGYYGGGFQVEDNGNSAVITEDNISMYSKNLDLKDIVKVNTQYSKVIRYEENIKK